MTVNTETGAAGPVSQVERASTLRIGGRKEGDVGSQGLSQGGGGNAEICVETRGTKREREKLKGSVRAENS